MTALGASILSAGRYVTTGSNVTTSGAQAIGTAAGVGTVLVAVLGGNATGWTPSITDSKGNTWTSVLTAGAQNSTNTTVSTFAFTCTVTVALTTSDTVTFGRSTNGGLYGNVFPATATAGTISGTPFGGDQGPGATNNTPITGTAYPCNTGDLIITAQVFSFSTYGAGDNIIAASGWTLADEAEAAAASNREVGLTWQVAGSTSVTPTIEANVNSNSYAMLTFALAAPVVQQNWIYFGTIVM